MAIHQQLRFRPYGKSLNLIAGEIDFCQESSLVDRLWAPWRLEYVKKGVGKPVDDFIVAADLSSADRENLVVDRTDLTIVILNRFPYNNGHLLISPRRAVADLEAMTEAEQLDCHKIMTRMVGALRCLLNPHGFNIGLNLGKAAGAGLPQHLHWHVVPRWQGDTNFMTVTGDANVIVQSLDELWLQLRKHLELPTE